MVKTKVFKSNQSQAVRFPKAVAFPEDVKDVEIVVVGNSRIVAPINQSWDSWFDSPPVSDDFMIDREQPVNQERESLDD
ncbi:MAG TPA: antitoxin [Crenotrichaceae bacterium]|nr:antitoxin [Crenotrichaceae bacterium]